MSSEYSWFNLFKKEKSMARNNRLALLVSMIIFVACLISLLSNHNKDNSQVWLSEPYNIEGSSGVIEVRVTPPPD